MLRAATIFLVIALTAALFGFGVPTGVAAGFAQILFLIFLTGFLISLLAGTLRST